MLLTVAIATAGPSGSTAATTEDPGWYARLVTSSGTIVARLLPEQAPQSVAYFVALARGELVWNDPFTGEPKKEPYYEGLKIHKAVAGQRFEVGDPTASGQGYAPFFLPHEGFGPIDFTRAGRLGNTRAGGGLISGSMFFVSSQGLPWLNGRHPCFGVVVEGREVVAAITGVKTDTIERPLETITLETVEIFSVGNPDPLPEPVHYEPKKPVFELRDDILKDGKWGVQRPKGDKQ
jgi:peptidyl-prolyl cis-trans isomerase A (cyclophilin A)